MKTTNMTDSANHSIKLARARRLCALGGYPASYAAMERHLPASLVANATAADIATVIQALWDCSQEGKAIAEREACDQGYIWDARADEMRDIIPSEQGAKDHAARLSAQKL